MKINLLISVSILTIIGLCAKAQNISGTTTDTTNISKSTKGTISKIIDQIKKHVTIYGFIRNEGYFDSRNNLYLREGLLNVYPLDKSGGTGRQDANNVSQLGYSAIVTRLGVKVDGVRVLGANATGVIVTDFFGVSNNPSTASVASSNSNYFGTQSLLRLRHAYVTLDWERVSFLAGQYWNPGFIAECFPGTANFNTGMPFNPFAFNPQLRFTYKLANPLSIMVMTYTYDIATFAPVVTLSTTPSSKTTAASGSIVSGVDAQRFSNIPSFATQLTYKKGNILASVGASINTLRPFLRDSINNGTYGKGGAGSQIININTNLITYNILAYFKLTTEPIVYKFYGTFGQTYTDAVGLGGFGIYRNATNGAMKYVPQNQLNLWAELIVTKNAHFQPAIFVGFAKNLGLNRSINSYYSGSSILFAGRGINTTRSYDYIYRFAPRLDVLYGPLKFSLEYEFSSMLFGKTNISNMKIVDTDADKFTAINHRLAFVIVYSF